MRKIHLVFNARLSRTICSFTDVKQMEQFVFIALNHYIVAAGETCTFDRLPTVNPSKEPIPQFDTSQEAIDHFVDYFTGVKA